jgi:hypothetical protein
MVSVENSNDHLVNNKKIGNDINVKKSVVTTDTHKLSFGAGDFMEHLTRTNTTDGGPSLKIEILNNIEVKDKT